MNPGPENGKQASDTPPGSTEKRKKLNLIIMAKKIETNYGVLLIHGYDGGCSTMFGDLRKINAGLKHAPGFGDLAKRCDIILKQAWETVQKMDAICESQTGAWSEDAAESWQALSESLDELERENMEIIIYKYPEAARRAGVSYCC